MVKKLGIILLLLVLLSSITGCSKTPKISDTLEIPTAAKCGGYEIQTAELNCRIVANGDKKYVSFQSVSGMGAEFYISSTEMIMLFTQNGQTSYHTEAKEGRIDHYPNPITRVLNDLRTLDFRCISVEDDWVYEAVKVEQISQEVQIDYTVYTVQMDWIDGEHYTFKYYIYADGATLISAEAPKEINPLLFADTPWQILKDEDHIVNNVTGQKVPFVITHIATGKALSPNGSANITEIKESIFIYCNNSDLYYGWLHYSHLFSLF